MKIITSQNIVNWADTDPRVCQAEFPTLIRKLIKETCDYKTIQEIRIPSGNNIQETGLDGLINLTKGTPYIPTGESAIEIGTSKDPQKKQTLIMQRDLKRQTNLVSLFS